MVFYRAFQVGIRHSTQVLLTHKLDFRGKYQFISDVARYFVLRKGSIEKISRSIVQQDKLTKMQTILLLGGFGFIGTNILKYADDFCLGEYKFIVVDRFPFHPMGINFSSIEKVNTGDFADEVFLEHIFSSNKIDVVIHAANNTVPATSQSAKFDVESNLIPTITLLETMLRHDVKNIVFLSSGGAIYGEGESSHKETDDVFPKSSYGVVKLSIEKYLFLYAWKGLRPLILRLSNPYGPYHYSMKQGIINVAQKCAENGVEFVVWGDGHATKDYIHVTDVCNILFNLLSRNIYGEVFNVASGELLSVNQILFSIKEYYPNCHWKYVSQNNTDVLSVNLDNSKLKSYLPEIKFTPFSSGLQDLVKEAEDATR